MGVYRECNKAFADIYNKAHIDLLKNKGKQTYEAKVKYNDGSIHDVLFINATTENQDGLVTGTVGNMFDITDQKISEKKVNRLLKLRETMLEINRFIIEVNDIRSLCNLVLEKVTSAMDNADLGCVLILDNDIQSMKWDKYRRPIESKDKVKVASSINTPILLAGKLYGFINIDSTQNNTFDELDLEVMDYVKNQIEMAISKYKLYEETIYLSRYDKLTDVFNRRYFEELFEGHLKNAINLKKKFFMVLFDLNGLKFVNDTYGHLDGDELIKALPNLLKPHIGKSDILARFGGDEFVAVFFEIELEDLIKKLENISKDFMKVPMIFHETNVLCSFSYGISEFPQDGDNYSELIKIANKNMYHYKKEVKH